MIKFFLLLIILFIFYFKNDIKESFVGCLPRYYNEEANVIDSNEVRHYGIIRNSSSDSISVEQIDSDQDPVTIKKDNIKNIVFNNCPNEKVFLPFLEVDGKSVKIPCDVNEKSFIDNLNFRRNNWSHDDYKKNYNYCRTKDNITCNNSIYDFNCNRSSNLLLGNYRENINYCDSDDDDTSYVGNNENDVSETCNSSGTLWDEFIDDTENSKCGCIDRIQFDNASDFDEKKDMIKQKVENNMKRNCYIYGDKCKGFSYHISDSEINDLGYENDNISYNAFYFNNCHLNFHQKIKKDNNNTFVKKYMNGNNRNICSDDDTNN